MGCCERKALRRAFFTPRISVFVPINLQEVGGEDWRGTFTTVFTAPVRDASGVKASRYGIIAAFIGIVTLVDAKSN
jgi:hypothetical protein